MGLIMRPIAVESPVDKNRQDFTIFSGKWETGRIYEAQPSTPLGPNSGNLRLPIIASGLNQDAAWHGSKGEIVLSSDIVTSRIIHGRSFYPIAL